MLKEDQAAELLARCERLVGRRLDQTRGNLRNAESRAAAVWELLCIDAFSQIGTLHHEPPGKSAPDIVLYDVGTSAVWVEVAYLYSRAWKNERRARDLLMWIYQEAARLKIPAVRISSCFFGDDNDPKGPSRTLPKQHEKSKVLRSEPLRAFFSAVSSHPDVSYSVRLDPYTVTLTYDPGARGPYVHSSGADEEQPTTVAEHALYRVLNGKTRQHKPDCPYIVCVGSDQSRALSHYGKPYGVTEQSAVDKIFQATTKISAVLAVSIETSHAFDNDFRLIAHSRLYKNPKAARPLERAQMDALSRVDFNRWRFYFALEPWELSDNTHISRSGGPLSMSTSSGTISLTVPSTVLVDCLAGKTSLAKEYPDRPGESLLRCIEDGWQMVECSFERGSIEQGLSNRVTLVLAPPPEHVFGMR